MNVEHELSNARWAVHMQIEHQAFQAQHECHAKFKAANSHMTGQCGFLIKSMAQMRRFREQKFTGGVK